MPGARARVPSGGVRVSIRPGRSPGEAGARAMAATCVDCAGRGTGRPGNRRV